MEKRLIRRQNSFTEGKGQPKKHKMSFARAPDMFMALMGDKDMSDPESLIDTDEDETTSKDSNNKTDALSSRSTNSLHNDAVDRTPTPSFFEDID